MPPTHTNWQLEMTRRMFLLTKEKAQAFSLLFREKSFESRDSRTLLDSIKDKLVTFILLLFNARVLGRHSTV